MLPVTNDVGRTWKVQKPPLCVRQVSCYVLVANVDEKFDSPARWIFNTHIKRQTHYDVHNLFACCRRPLLRHKRNQDNVNRAMRGDATTEDADNTRQRDMDKLGMPYRTPNSHIMWD